MHNYNKMNVKIKKNALKNNPQVGIQKDILLKT